VIDDGSIDGVDRLVKGVALTDDRIQYYNNVKNEGLGYTLNRGIELSRSSRIAYLPADDIYFENHLSTLMEVLDRDPGCVLANSGLRYDYHDSIQSSQGRTTTGTIEGTHLQLVQVMHRKVVAKWVERQQIVTDDLDFMYWKHLRAFGSFVGTGQVSAEWVSHPLQRHKLINELRWWGGIHRYRQHYGVTQKLRFKSSTGHYIDEYEDYKSLDYRISGSAVKSLKILIVGELAYNAERICALETHGHKLFGLWIDRPYFFNTTGPLPFGNVEDVPYENWEERVKQIQPDIIYALLNSYAVPLAHEVMTKNLGIPFVWHFKEGPFVCRQQGMWDKLVDLFQKSDGQIYINAENQSWFEQFLRIDHPNPHILDGDLPSKFYFKDQRSEPLPSTQGQVHTVVPGRPFGIHPADVREMAKNNIHLHIYGDISHKTYEHWLNQVFEAAGDHVHLYHNCPPSEWTSEFSKFDAGWLHLFSSSNRGELLKMDWMDLNYPARMTTLAAAGLPMIQKNNEGNLVATQTITKRLDTAVFFSDFEDLARQLRDQTLMRQVRENCWNNRMFFSFDYHVDSLVAFFHKTLQQVHSRSLAAV